MNSLTPQQVLDLPMEPNGGDADTIRGYLVNLLAEVWEHQEGFSGKRPFGDSGWEWDLMTPLVKAEAIEGRFDEDGFLDDCDEAAGTRLIASAIQSLHEAVQA